MTSRTIIREALRVSKKVLIIEAKPTRLTVFLDLTCNKLLYPKSEFIQTHRTKSNWIKLFKKKTK